MSLSLLKILQHPVAHKIKSEFHRGLGRPLNLSPTYSAVAALRFFCFYKAPALGPSRAHSLCLTEGNFFLPGFTVSSFTSFRHQFKVSLEDAVTDHPRVMSQPSPGHPDLNSSHCPLPSCFFKACITFWDFSGGRVGKNLPFANAGDKGLIPGWGTTIPRVSEQLERHGSGEPQLEDPPAAVEISRVTQRRSHVPRLRPGAPTLKQNECNTFWNHLTIFLVCRDASEHTP